MQMQLTDTALTKVQSFLDDHGAGEDAGLRVAVLPGGCSGFQYGVSIEDTPQDEDEILHLSHGIRVFVDPFSAQYFGGRGDRLREQHDRRRVRFQKPRGYRRLRVRQFVHGLTPRARDPV